MPCRNGQTLSNKRKHGVRVPNFVLLSALLLLALGCLQAGGSSGGPQGPGDSGGGGTAARSPCSPCPVNCSCLLLGPQLSSCVVNCSNVGLERAPAAQDVPLATNVL